MRVDLKMNCHNHCFQLFGCAAESVCFPHAMFRLVLITERACACVDVLLIGSGTAAEQEEVCGRLD